MSCFTTTWWRAHGKPRISALPRSTLGHASGLCPLKVVTCAGLFQPGPCHHAGDHCRLLLRLAGNHLQKGAARQCKGGSGAVWLPGRACQHTPQAHVFCHLVLGAASRRGKVTHVGRAASPLTWPLPGTLQAGLSCITADSGGTAACHAMPCCALLCRCARGPCNFRAAEHLQAAAGAHVLCCAVVCTMCCTRRM